MTLIFDTDMDTDCDDAGALALLHALRRRRECALGAVICSIPVQACADCALAINRACGAGDTPVGLVRVPDWATAVRHQAYREHRDRGEPLYNQVVAEQVGGGASVYPDAVRLYRELLAAAAPGTVSICATGTLTALAQLLDSEPDTISALPGHALVEAKAVTLVSMAEAFAPEGRDGFNWRMDLPATARVTAHWPAPMMVSPRGCHVLTGARLMADVPPEHPVHTAYLTWLKDPGGNRSSWDQVAALFAVRGPTDVLSATPGLGLVVTADDGHHQWTNAPGPHPRGLIDLAQPPEAVATHIEDLMIEGCEGLRKPYVSLT